MAASKINFEKSIENQIVSMLNDVMIDDNDENKNEDNILTKEKFIIQSDSDSIEDERETNCSSQITFPKESNKIYKRKSVPFPYQHIQTNSEFSRRIINKNCKTQMMNSYVLKQLNSIDNINQFHIYSNQQYQNNSPINEQNNMNNYFLLQQCYNNINNDIPILNNYNETLKSQQYGMLLNYNIPFNNIYMNNLMFSQEDSSFETQLINEGKFTYDIYLQFKHNFISIIKNQQTSRLSQLYVQHSPPEIIHLLYTEISSQINQLLLDPYANYFILKLFYFLDNSDCLHFLNQISKNFTNLSINKISTYPIQCIIETLTSKHFQEQIIDSVKNHLMKITLDIYGTHVLEKIISKFNYELIQPISKFVVDNFVFLANNANGICVIKKVIVVEYKKNYFDKIKRLSEENALTLIQNPYGNYALQCIIDNWQKEDINIIMKAFIGKCKVLSIQKYSSNVIEKCIEKSKEFLNEFINECISDNFCGIGILMQNNYGNYVIQTALKIISGKERKEFIIGIEKHLMKFTDKKILSKWKNMLLNSSSIHA